MKKSKVFIICLILSLLFPVCVFLLSGCKTRKVEKDKAEIKKEIKKEQSGTSSEIKKDSTVDKSTEQKETLTEAKNESKATAKFTADSVVTEQDPITGKKKTKAFGVKFEGSLDKNRSENKKETSTKQNDIKSGSVFQRDSSGQNKSSFKSDSTSVSKKTDAKGSGKTFGVAFIIGVVLVTIVYIILTSRKNKNMF